LVNDFRVTHLPVVSDDKYLGLISEEDLLDAEEVKNAYRTNAGKHLLMLQ